MMGLAFRGWVVASGAKRKLGGKAEAMPHKTAESNQVTGDKIAGATSWAQLARKLWCW